MPPAPGATAARSTTSVSVGVAREPLVDSIKAHEGLRLHLYQDTDGHWTVGYGTMVETISQVEAEWLLRHRLDVAIGEVLTKWPWVADLDAVRQDVVYELGYAMGTPTLSQFTQTLGAIASGRHEAAARGLLDSHWAEQVGHRAEVLAMRLRTGHWA